MVSWLLCFGRLVSKADSHAPLHFQLATNGGPTKIPSQKVWSGYMWILSDSDLTSLINFQGVCVTRLMCSPLAGNFWSTPVSVHKGLIHGVMTSLPWETGLQSWQSCTIALALSVGYTYLCLNATLLGRAQFKPWGIKKNSVLYMAEVVLTNVLVQSRIVYP